MSVPMVKPKFDLAPDAVVVPVPPWEMLKGGGNPEMDMISELAPETAGAVMVQFALPGAQLGANVSPGT